MTFTGWLEYNTLEDAIVAFKVKKKDVANTTVAREDLPEYYEEVESTNDSNQYLKVP